jgi:hypothetical protein
MATINYKSNQIRLNLPNKVLPVTVSNVIGEEYWPYPNAADDIWYSGSPTKKYYRWRITFTVTEINHGSNLTRNNFKYNGLDIVTGDWIAGATAGICLKIISIISKTETQLTCVVEDWLRYNTFRSATGNGMFNTGPAVVFSLNEIGVPVLDPLPVTVSNNFYASVMSRFQYLNPSTNYVLEKQNHGFQKGDAVAVAADGFVRANLATMSKMIGVVTEAGPGPNLFIIHPNNKIIDFEPAIPGTVSDFVYVSNDGTLTVADTGKIAFLKIQDAIPTVLSGTKNNPTVPQSHVVAFNNVGVTFSGAGGVVVLNEIITQINAQTANHSVVASVFPAPTQISSVANNTAYGVVGGFIPFSAYIDSGSGNTLINFTTTINGEIQFPGSGVAIAADMVIDIASANIANLVVSESLGLITLTELNGNAINIYNGTPEANGFDFVGNSNISGLPQFTPATTGDRLRLTRSDGGEILIFEGTAFFSNSTGLFSGHTGMYPLAMNIEQGIRSGTTTVVADISARNSLSARIGDQAYVIDAGRGEWAMYLYDGSDWVQLGTQDSSTVDAKTLITTFEMPSGELGDFIVKSLGNISPGRKIVSISFDVDVPFSEYIGPVIPNIEVGTIGNTSLLIDGSTNDLTESTQFVSNPEFLHPIDSPDELNIVAKCNHYGAVFGSVLVKLTYV